MPKGREPNPTLMSGEGIEPYELYYQAMKALYAQSKKQACTWYMVVDVCAYDRQDQIIFPPEGPIPHTQGPGLPSGLSSGKGKGNEKGKGKCEEEETIHIAMFLAKITLSPMGLILGSAARKEKGGEKGAAIRWQRARQKGTICH